MASPGTSPSEAQGAVRIVVAHAREARPLIDHFGLHLVPGCEPLRVYERDNVSLVVSRLGKVAAGVAVAHLAGLKHEPAAWLNVGVAGHRTQPLGSVHLVHKVVDRASGERWYPQRTFAAPCPGATLITVDRPENAYAEEALYDMEGAGFCKACARYSTLELVQLVKVVSDNADHPVSRFEPRQAERLIAGALDVVGYEVANLASLSADVAAWRARPPGWEAFTERWHFTVTQRRQLRRLLQRWSLLAPGTVAIEATREARSARDALACLHTRLDRMHPDFGVGDATHLMERR